MVEDCTASPAPNTALAQFVLPRQTFPENSQSPGVMPFPSKQQGTTQYLPSLPLLATLPNICASRADGRTTPVRSSTLHLPTATATICRAHRGLAVNRVQACESHISSLRWKHKSGLFAWGPAAPHSRSIKGCDEYVLRGGF